jgi:hypothetical protein
MKTLLLISKMLLIVCLAGGVAVVVAQSLKPLIKTSVRYYGEKVGIYDMEAKRRPKDMTLNPAKYRQEALNWEPQ